LEFIEIKRPEWVSTDLIVAILGGTIIAFYDTLILK